MRTVIERELDLTLVLSPRRSVTVPAQLVYRTEDPLAVHVTFHLGSHAPVHWTFARELLLDGLFRPSGQGDVRVWPARAGDRPNGAAELCLSLNSPDGEALLRAPASAVSSWLERTLRAVPVGTELEGMGVDEALEELLSAAPDRSRRTADEAGDHPEG